ncbi:hypothetical protein LIER_14255 [Lithospermum erythrorhizon]|uniref:Uncharacterized protein n=1 Tax=Lithospermum erythrorhizon TaxID=34254 RepID=A0AAV3Q0E9_LITER
MIRGSCEGWPALVLVLRPHTKLPGYGYTLPPFRVIWEIATPFCPSRPKTCMRSLPGSASRWAHWSRSCKISGVKSATTLETWR